MSFFGWLFSDDDDDDGDDDMDQLTLWERFCDEHDLDPSDEKALSGSPGLRAEWRDLLDEYDL